MRDRGFDPLVAGWFAERFLEKPLAVIRALAEGHALQEGRTPDIGHYVNHKRPIGR